MGQLSPRPHVREIIDTDLDAAINLLSLGFPQRSRAYWEKGFERLAHRPVPAGIPKYGYVIAVDKELAGIILLISTLMQFGEEKAIRSNLSSWFIKLPFRSLSTLLIKRAVSLPKVTYVNISAARHTWRTIEAQGFSRYSDGQFVALPIGGTSNRKVKILEADSKSCLPFQAFEHRLLLDHARYGCICLWCCTSNGRYPFVFLPRIVRPAIPCVQLIYCRNIEDYVRFSRPLGWYMARRGRPFTIIDSNGPIKGLSGRYFQNSAPKYFKGPFRPQLGDLSYTEAPIFGL